MRTERLGFLPSAWTTPVSTVVGPGVPALYSLSIQIDEIYDAPRIAWTRNSLALGVRIEYSFDDPSATPSYSSSVDADATVGEYVLVGQPLLPGDKLNVRVTPYAVFAGEVASGTAGSPLYASRNG